MRRMENILGAQVAVLLTAGLLSFSHAQTLHTSPHGEGLRGLAPAMRVATPKIRWQLTLPAGIAHGSITFSNNGQYLYFKTFGDKQGQVFKVEAATGNIVWQTNPTTIGFGRFSYSGVVVDEQNGRLYTTGTPSSTPYNQSIVAALNINTGTIIWVKTASDLGLSGRNLGTGNLLLHSNRTRLYVRDDNNPDRIVALDASNGNRIWTYNMPNNFDSDSWMLHRTLGPIWTDPVSERVRIAFVNNSTVGSVGAIQDNGNSASLAWSANVAQSMEYHWWGNGNGGSAQAAAKSEARPAHSSKASSQPLRISPSSVLSCVLLLLTVAGLFCCATVYLRNGLSCQVDIPYCSCASQWAHSRWIPEFSGKPCHIHWVFLAIHKQNADRRWTKQHIEEVGTMRRLTEVMHRTAQRLAGLTDRALSSERFDDAVRKRVFNGKHLVSLMTCLSYIAWGLAQVPAPDQLTENSAQQWFWAVEGQGTASIRNSTTRVRVGRASLQIDTSCPFKTAVFVVPPGARANLSAVSAMAFWVYAENPNPVGFQDNSPWIRLYTTHRDYFEFRPNRDLMNDARNQWLEIVVPFYLHPDWTVNRVGNPDLSVVRVIEIITDTWDWQPYRYWLDGLRFLSIESITPNPNPIIGGNSATGTVTISAPAPTGGFPVQLRSNSNVATVPTSVTIPAGQRTATFTISTNPVASPTQVVITGWLGNSSRQATLTVNPPALESLTLDPNTVVGGNPSTGRVALNAPAPAGGLQVQLSSNNPNVASVPASVTVPAGQRSATFTVNTQAVASQTQVTITATLNGRSRSATLTVNPRPVIIERVEVYAPNPVVDDRGERFPVAGRRVNIRITLREPAPYRAEVRLRCSHPSVLPTPDRVYFEVGQQTLEMSIDTQRVHQNTTVTVTASNNFSERSGRIQLYKTVIRDVVFNPNPVRAGNEFTVTITMSEHIPSGGYYITISNGNPNVIEIRPDVRAREGRQPPISDFDARARRGVRQETRVTITFRGENGEVFRRTITVRP